jgi:hypothetical protein
MNLIVQFAPWILFALVSDVDWRLGIAVGLVAQLVLILASHPRRLGVLNGAMLAFFAVVGVVAIAQPDSPIQGYVNVLSAAWLAIVAGASIVVDHPFTLDVSRGTVPPEVEASPVFMATNRTITAAWAATFAGLATAGAAGEALGLHRLDTIASIVLLIIAVRFTVRYPKQVHARVAAQHAAAQHATS